MNPALIVIIIRGVIRIGKVSASAYEQYLRDRPALLPLVDMIEATPEIKIKEMMLDDPAFQQYVESDSQLGQYWPFDGKSAEEREIAVAELYAAVITYLAESSGGSAGSGSDVDAAIGGMFVTQWSKGQGPVGPLSRVILTLADVAVEYIGGNPQILGVGGNGEKLIGALASNLAELIPDATDAGAYGPKARFGERLAAQFLHAGLKTATENPGLMFDEEHLVSLVEKTLPPIITALPASVADQVKWKKVTGALTGPAASAAIQVIAENQVKFLGQGFDADTAIGALTKAMLTTAHTQGLDEQFTRDGMIVLYRSLVQVAVDRPELFLGRADSNAEKIGEAVFTKVLGRLQAAPVPFNGALGAHLAAAALEALNENSKLFFDPEKPWENAASQIVGQVIGGFKEAFQKQSTGPIESLLTGEQLISFARIVLVQIGKTPGMVTGNDTDKSVQDIVAAIGMAMAKDDKLLLTADDWLKIVAVAAEEAARSPGRLFGIETATREGQVAERLISIALKAASTDLQNARKGVMFGETLVEAVSFLLRTASGNVRKLADNALSQIDGDPDTSKLESLFDGINALVRQHAQKYGHREWLRLVKVLVLHLMETGVLPTLNEPALDRILETGKV